MIRLEAPGEEFVGAKLKGIASNITKSIAKEAKKDK